MEIRGHSIAFSARQKKETQTREEHLEIEILELEKKIDSEVDTHDANTEAKLQQTKDNLIALRRERVKGLMLRSRARWIEFGEKPTKYFCSLEKRNYVNKLITKLNVNGTEVVNPEEILKEQKNFYQKLYSRKLYTNVETENDTIKFLNPQNVNPILYVTREILDGCLTEKEIKDVLKNMKNDKTPGTDGLPADFYKVFWKDIGRFVMRSLDYALKKKVCQ